MNRLRILLVLVAVLTLAGANAHAGGISVSPMQLKFGADRGISAVTLTNTSRETLTVEADVLPWPLDAEGQASRDIIVNPPISTLAPGEKITVRVGLVKRLSNEVERSYRLYFTELPSLRPQEALGIGVRLRLGIPVFVTAGSAQPRALQWSADRDEQGVFVVASNAGNIHQRVSRLSTQQGAAQFSAAQSSPYVLPGRSTTFRMPGLAAQSGDRLTLQVQADDGPRQVEVRVP